MPATASPSDGRTVLITGVGRRRSIGATIAARLAAAGFDLVLSHWQPYDERIGLERGADDPAAVAQECRAHGVRVRLIEADLAEVETPERLVAAAGAELSGMVLSHCESTDSSVLDTTVESWDRHYAVNARATWLLLRALGERLPEAETEQARAQVVALTSDHTAHNLPYGSSKGALDRIVTAAAVELGSRGLRANVVNPGPIDTGWMDEQIRAAGVSATPAGRLGTAQDTADLIEFLLSPGGAWITGQVLHSNGGFRVGA